MWPFSWGTSRPQHAAADPLPVVYIAGYQPNGSTWGVGKLYLESKGYRVFQATTSNNVPLNALSVATTIHNAMQATGAPRVHVVASSMGGVAAMYYAKVLGGHKYMESLTTIDAPLTGLAPFWDFLACLDLVFNGGVNGGWMCKGGPFMRSLQEGDWTPGTPFYTQIINQSPSQIQPPLLDCIDRSFNTLHPNLFWDPAVFERVIKAFSKQCPGSAG